MPIAAMHIRLPIWVDAVEKVGLSVGVMLLGGFDPAEMSRAVRFCGRVVGGDFDADATGAMVSDLRQAMRAAVPVVVRGFEAPGS